MIGGPTASGKTELALALARRLGGEIVSADSRQLYRDLQAGTAKPRREGGCVEAIPYHLIDCLELSEAFDAGRFAGMARGLCEEIRARGKLPILAGGTGLYLRAFLEGLPQMPQRHPPLRLRLEQECRERGRGWLHQRLSRVDPAAAARIPPGNIQRLIRALEVWELTGKPISSLWDGPRKGEDGALVLKIEWPPRALATRILERARATWPGLLAEARKLAAQGRRSEPGLESLGYREALLCARGELAPEKAFAALLRATLAYAKRQRTWFRRQLNGVVIPGGSPEEMLEKALAAVAAVLRPDAGGALGPHGLRAAASVLAPIGNCVGCQVLRAAASGCERTGAHGELSWAPSAASVLAPRRQVLAAVRAWAGPS